MTGTPNELFAVPKRDGRRPATCSCGRGFVLLAALWLSGCCLGLARASETLLLTNLGQVYSLPLADAHQSRPFRFRGTVLCYDAEWNQLYIQGVGEVAYFSPQSLGGSLTPGQCVEINATTGVNGNNPILTNFDVTILGQKPLPPPRRLRLPDLASAPGQWVQVEGTVRAAETSRGRLCLLLRDADQTCPVLVMGSPGTNDARRWVGSRVAVSAINSSQISQGRLVSPNLLAPGINSLITREPSPAHPLQVPVASIEGLLSREIGSWTNDLVHLSGLVLACKPGESLVLKDPTGMIRAQVSQATQAEPDERVDLWGYLKVLTNETVLEDAFFEVAQNSRPNFETPFSAAAASASGARHKTLTQVNQVMKLGPRQSAERVPVRLRGVITFADPRWNSAFLQDPTDALFFKLTQPEVRAGQWVELTGYTGPGDFAPVILDARVRIVGTTNFPRPVRVDLDELADGHLDSHWVQMEGVVHRVTTQDNHPKLSLTTPKGRFHAYLPDLGDKPPPAELIDALVRIQGACESELNQRGQLSGITLHVPSLEKLQILEAASTAPFTAPAKPISAVATFDPNHLAGRRIKLAGIVTLVLPGQAFFLQDSSGAIRVHTQQAGELRRGDFIEVLGFPGIGDFSPYLEEVIFRRLKPGALPAPLATTAEQILRHGTNDSAVVRLQAQLLQRISDSAQPKLVLQDGPLVFSAYVTSRTGRRRLSSLLPGSLLRLTGVCSVQGTEQHEAQSFHLLLPESDAVELSQAPPFWTAGRALVLAAGLALVIGLALLWAGALRRQVRRQTQDLRAAQEQLVLAARQAGMAEVATSVLHNVGNVLNSVNVSTTLLADKLKQSRAANVAKIAALLREHLTDAADFLTRDPKGRQLPLYLEQLADRLIKDQTSALDEVDSLAKNVGHIKAIVAMQQTYARVADVAETVRPVDLVEDAVSLNQGALGRHHVQVIRQYAPGLPDLVVDKHKVLQILVNLIANSKFACQESGRDDKRVTLGIANGGATIKFSVADNGVGIAPENLTRIFNLGFTTRKHGHGFGLHSGALAAKELGGSLSVQSAGPGQGTTFTLELPLANKPAPTLFPTGLTPGRSESRREDVLATADA
ncbi:MAG TPA: HAMP domain-containing sensor histidine kinase [Candidatus Binatia bacterium]|jgi:signal transduction histidine kinase|nr:HAMP domain-containing sensor histidine kinase [Candidatus Binatia bacterium]